MKRTAVEREKMQQNKIWKLKHSQAKIHRCVVQFSWSRYNKIKMKFNIRLLVWNGIKRQQLHVVATTDSQMTAIVSEPRLHGCRSIRYKSNVYQRSAFFCLRSFLFWFWKNILIRSESNSMYVSKTYFAWTLFAQQQCSFSVCHIRFLANLVSISFFVVYELILLMSLS